MYIKISAIGKLLSNTDKAMNSSTAKKASRTVKKASKKASSTAKKAMTSSTAKKVSKRASSTAKKVMTSSTAKKASSTAKKAMTSSTAKKVSSTARRGASSFGNNVSGLVSSQNLHVYGSMRGGSSNKRGSSPTTMQVLRGTISKGPMTNKKPNGLNFQNTNSMQRKMNK